MQFGCPNVDVARNETVYAFRESGLELFLFRDDDVFISPKDIQRMIDARADIIVAPYWRRDGDRFDIIDRSGVVEGAGLGMTLIRRRVIDRLWTGYESTLGYDQVDMFGRRHLVHLFSDFFAQRDDGVELVKEDRAFFFRVREAGYTIAVLDDVVTTHAKVTKRYLKAETASNSAVSQYQHESSGGTLTA